jgi:hypothetical protein
LTSVAVVPQPVPVIVSVLREPKSNRIELAGVNSVAAAALPPTSEVLSSATAAVSERLRGTARAYSSGGWAGDFVQEA